MPPGMSTEYLARMHARHLARKRSAKPPAGVLTYGDQLGSKNWNATLTERQVVQIREAVASGKTHAEVAKRFGTPRNNVARIATGQAWSHVGGPRTRRRPTRA